MGVDGANEGASSGQEGAWNAPAGACISTRTSFKRATCLEAYLGTQGGLMNIIYAIKRQQDATLHTGMRTALGS